MTPIPAPALKNDLNAGQQAAANAFFEFLFTEEKEFGISGPGGTGKTHLMSFMIDEIMPRYLETCKLLGIEPRFEKVQMTATTNKAAEVLAVATQRPTSTIHSYMNLKVQEDYATGRSKLTPMTTWIVHENTILFIDEGSMVDTPLDQFIQKGTSRCKIVWVGDHCQLAPIMEPISPIYRRTMPFYELTEPMRTVDPDLLALNQQTRQTVIDGIFNPIKLVPGKIDLLTDDEMQAELVVHFQTQNYDNRILAYTNSRVVEYNDFVRQIRQLPDEYTIGENLVNNTAMAMKRYMLSVEEEITILAQKEEIELMPVDIGNDGVPIDLKVRRSTIESRVGGVFTDIPLPVDRNHYAQLLKYYARIKNWHKLYDLKKTVPDLRMRDSATFHKAQGSSYDVVFIDAGNLSTCHQSDSAARMLYVAVSRARTRICFYGELAAKYGGFIR